MGQMRSFLMIDYTQYSWLDTSKVYPEGKEEQTNRILKTLDKKEMPDAKKNILAQYYFHRLTEDNFKVETDASKAIKHWQKSKKFQSVQAQYLKDEETQYMMTGISMVITGTLFLFFLAAVLRQKFLINFSVDAIVGAIALAIFIRNILLKYKLIHRYTNEQTYLYMDVFTFIFCIVVKMVFPPNLDFSLIILFIDYLFSKRRFHALLETFSKS